MQFYLDGYVPGDPDILAAAPDAEARSLDLPETVDVLIVGAGHAGMLLSAQLSTFPGIRTRLVERREGPLQVGQADGVACRTVEMFDAFGLSGRLLRESYWVNETAFWRPSRSRRSSDFPTGSPLRSWLRCLPGGLAVSPCWADRPRATVRASA